MAEEFYLVSKSEYEQLMPDKPLPQESVDIKKPPPGLPKQGVVTEKKQVGMGSVNYAYDDESDTSSDNESEAEESSDWRQNWRSL